jgi:hypothetical protein
MAKLTKKQMAKAYNGYLVNVKGGYVYVNDHGDIEFVSSDSIVDETIKFDLEY